LVLAGYKKRRMPLIEEITSDTSTEVPATSTSVQIEVVDNIPEHAKKGQ
jgi:hypothetical protein